MNSRNFVIFGLALGMSCGGAAWALSTAGHAPSESSTSEGSPNDFGLPQDQPGPGLSPTEALDTALRNMQGTSITDAFWTDPPDSIGKPASRWLHVDLTTNDPRSAAPSEYAWETEMFVGAVLELSHDHELSADAVVAGSDGSLRYPDGSTENVGNSIGYVATGLVFPAQRQEDPDDDLAAQTRALLEQHGLKVEQIDVLHPLGPALRAVAVVPDHAAVNWSVSELMADILGRPFQVEGLYLELRNEQGRVLVRQGNSYRTGDAMVWFDSIKTAERFDLEVLSPIYDPDPEPDFVPTWQSEQPK